MFRRGGIAGAEVDARLLAEEAFGMGRLELVTREREEATAEQLARLQKLAERRLRGEPVARILGVQDFWGLTFRLDPATLVPRPETELVVSMALGALGGTPRPRILDLGTGSGCIAIALLHELQAATAVAIELSPAAAAMARDNAERLEVGKRLEVREGSWFEPLRPGERFDIVVSNPPYIEHAVIPTLQPEVREHDPLLALDGGADGLDAYRAILAGIRTRLRQNGAIVVEIGSDQGPKVAGLLRDRGFVEVRIEKDLAGLDRVVIGYHS